MKLANEVSVFLWLLRTAVLLLGLGTVWVFARMSPAIDHILADNVRTLEATETMLAALARPESSEAPGRFEAALRVAAENQSEPAEAPLIRQLEQQWAERGAADLAAMDRRKVVAILEQLSKIHRTSMEQANAEARRLGAAGGWVVVLLGLLVLGGSQMFARRLDDRVVRPLLSIADAATAIEGGNRYRRCSVGEGSAEELRRIAAGIDHLLDEAGRPSRRAPRRVRPPEPDRGEDGRPTPS